MGMSKRKSFSSTQTPKAVAVATGFVTLAKSKMQSLAIFTLSGTIRTKPKAS